VYYDQKPHANSAPRREKQKQKMIDLSNAVEMLTSQVENLQSVEKEHTALKEKNDMLEKMLREAQCELQAMRHQVEAKAQEAPPKHADDLQVKYMRWMELSQELAELLNAFEAKPTPEGESLIAQKVAQVIGMCCEVQAGTGVSHCDLMFRNVDKLIKEGFFGRNDAQLTEHCKMVASKLSLSRAEQDRILSWRHRYLEKLDQIYQERQQLNVHAMFLQGLASQSINAQLNTNANEDLDMGPPQQSSLAVTHHNVLRTSERTQEVYEKLRKNMTDEQAMHPALMLEFFTSGTILAPLQIARFFVYSMPEPADALALANVLALQEEASAASPSMQASS